MKIGHRGVAGYAPENTIRSILTAIQYGVDGIEFDVRQTKDKKLVLCHDPTLKRIAHDRRRISELTLSEIRDIVTHHGEPIPTLEEALEAVGDTPVIIEVKESGTSDLLIPILNKFHATGLSIASFDHQEMRELLHKRPDLPVYLLERNNPLEVIQHARAVGAFGVGLNFWLLNPLTYILARRAGLELYVYTVNKPFIGAFIHRLYPHTQICTNFPDRITIKQKLEQLRTKQPKI